VDGEQEEKGGAEGGPDRDAGGWDARGASGGLLPVTRCAAGGWAFTLGSCPTPVAAAPAGGG